jgi:hypothetical protein
LVVVDLEQLVSGRFSRSHVRKCDRRRVAPGGNTPGELDEGEILGSAADQNEECPRGHSLSRLAFQQPSSGAVDSETARRILHEPTEGAECQRPPPGAAWWPAHDYPADAGVAGALTKKVTQTAGEDTFIGTVWLGLSDLEESSARARVVSVKEPKGRLVGDFFDRYDLYGPSCSADELCKGDESFQWIVVPEYWDEEGRCLEQRLERPHDE